MISNKEHLKALMQVEHDRMTILFAIPTAMILFLFMEMGRRQRIGEAREESRRVWVDGQLSKLNEDAIGHRERSQGIQNIFRALAVAATIAVGIVAIIGLLLSSHAIG